MKLVIDIPEEIVESVKYGNVYIAGTRSNGKTILCKITDAIANGTPLTDCTDAISRSAVIESALNVPIAPIVEGDKVTVRRVVFLDEILELPTATPTRPRAIDDTLSRKIYDNAETKDIYSLDGTVSTMLVIGVDTVMDIIADYLKGGDSDA